MVRYPSKIPLLGTPKHVLIRPLLSSACIRGHRSSRCKHVDRPLLDVRKPGRPLTSCPHPPGRQCACVRLAVQPQAGGAAVMSSSTTSSASLTQPSNTTLGQSNHVQADPAQQATIAAGDGLMLSDSEVRELDQLLLEMNGPGGSSASTSDGAQFQQSRR